MNRKQRVDLAQQTVAILERCRYTNPAGAAVDLRTAIEDAVDDTRLYRPGEALPQPGATDNKTRVGVGNETTLAASRRLQGEGHDVVALNFASARNPGGGFLNGSLAQEESLATASALFACIKDSEYYAYHRARRCALYSDHMIYSPAVPVFRDDESTLLESSWPCSFITSPAVNVGALRKNSPYDAPKIEPTMRKRIARILRIGAAHGHDAIVLGAFGCGVFGNSPDDVAAWFDEALRYEFAGVFTRVHFAVLDRHDGPTYRAFADRFGDGP